MTEFEANPARRALDEQQTPTSLARPRGRVLRVKEGYNPNSSSIGTALPSYLVFAAASGAVTLLLLNLRTAVGSLLRSKNARRRAEDESPSAAQDDEDEAPSAETE